MNTKIANNIKKIRNQMGLTQVNFAKLLNIPQPALSLLESGKQTPSIDILIKIAQESNISLDWLCGLSEIQSTNSSVSLASIFNFFLDLKFSYEGLTYHLNKSMIPFSHSKRIPTANDINSRDEKKEITGADLHFRCDPENENSPSNLLVAFFADLIEVEKKGPEAYGLWKEKWLTASSDFYLETKSQSELRSDEELQKMFEQRRSAREKRKDLNT